MVKNYIETLVDQAVQELLKDHTENAFTCTCDACIDSIKAIALNHLKPFYVTTKTGEVFGAYRNLESQKKIDVISELIKAKELVEKRPKH